MTCDESLYRQYLSGDDEGLNALMKKYGDPLTLYIDGYLHDVHESEELMLDVFAYLFTKKPRIVAVQISVVKSLVAGHSVHFLFAGAPNAEGYPPGACPAGISVLFLKARVGRRFLFLSLKLYHRIRTDSNRNRRSCQ